MGRGERLSSMKTLFKYAFTLLQSTVAREANIRTASRIGLSLPFKLSAFLYLPRPREDGSFDAIRWQLFPFVNRLFHMLVGIVHQTVILVAHADLASSNRVTQTLTSYNIRAIEFAGAPPAPVKLLGVPITGWICQNPNGNASQTTFAGNFPTVILNREGRQGRGRTQDSSGKR